MLDTGTEYYGTCILSEFRINVFEPLFCKDAIKNQELNVNVDMQTVI